MRPRSAGWHCFYVIYLCLKHDCHVCTYKWYFVFPAFNVFNSAAAACLHWKVSLCQFFTDLSLGEYQSQGKTFVTHACRRCLQPGACVASQLYWTLLHEALIINAKYTFALLCCTWPNVYFCVYICVPFYHCIDGAVSWELSELCFQASSSIQSQISGRWGMFISERRCINEGLTFALKVVDNSISKSSCNADLRLHTSSSRK